jgi:hypothetical protein
MERKAREAAERIYEQQMANEKAAAEKAKINKHERRMAELNNKRHAQPPNNVLKTLGARYGINTKGTMIGKISPKTAASLKRRRTPTPNNNNNSPRVRQRKQPSGSVKRRHVS